MKHYARFMPHEKIARAPEELNKVWEALGRSARAPAPGAMGHGASGLTLPSPQGRAIWYSELTFEMWPEQFDKTNLLLSLASKPIINSLFCVRFESFPRQAAAALSAFKDLAR
jgi:hypothetical protein